MENQVLYQLALNHIEGIGTAYTKKLIGHFGDALSVFRADRQSLERTGLRHPLIDAILAFSGFPALETELRLLRRHDIRILFVSDPEYPKRLLNIETAPPLLFYQGSANLNERKIVAIVGTRRSTDYGNRIAERLVRELTGPDVLIISGLAFGIDAAAHKAALTNKLPTVGVLGSGLGNIYPAQHAELARKMREKGGLLSYLPLHAGASDYRFLLRNNLIAGMCDALVIVESDIPGGSLYTAEKAMKFKKKCFAVPGRLIDEKSRGCLKLIHEKSAMPLLSARQLCATMGWDYTGDRPAHQPLLPFFDDPAGLQPGVPESTSPFRLRPGQQPGAPISKPPPDPNPLPPGTFLGGDSQTGKQLFALLQKNETLAFEDMIAQTHLTIPILAGALLDLELRGIIRALPGKRYRLTD